MQSYPKQIGYSLQIKSIQVLPNFVNKFPNGIFLSLSYPTNPINTITSSNNLLSAYIFVSMILFVVARLDPYEWNNPYPCIEEPEEVENAFTLLNSFWFTIGTLLQQGSDVAPGSLATRIIAAMWFFFAMMMVASYTANLAAFLTVETLDKPIESAEDLAAQGMNPPIKYGVVAGGSTMNFFRTSTMEPFQTMWEYMSGPERELIMMGSNTEGIEKVIETDGKYAFMMESSSIQYIIERNCLVTQIGGNLDNKVRYFFIAH